jgi:hypothetical protein
LEKIGLANSIYDAAAAIDFGRKGFATRGKAEEGRISYEDGITQALSAFREAQVTTDPETIILAEYSFLCQELQFCHKNDNAAISSLTQAIQGFDDAFLALKVVEEKIHYHAVDDAIPHHKDYRHHGFPLDSFHVACKSHKTRLQNILRAPGIDPIEKDLLQQRHANLPVAQSSYTELQRIALQNRNKVQNG